MFCSLQTQVGSAAVQSARILTRETGRGRGMASSGGGLLRPSRLLRERKFTQAGSGGYMNNVGGIPFYGNIYAGRVNTDAYIPPPQQGSGLIGPRAFIHNDPAVKQLIDACPYFALCDLVVWHNMDPQFLDPGILSRGEHLMLLLYSRSYYEKWSNLHSRADVCFPRVRTRRGTTSLLKEMFECLSIPSELFSVATEEYLLDDAAIVGMKRGDGYWETANLDEAVRDHLSGRVLDFIGLSETQQEHFLSLLDQMRRLVVRRRDIVDERTNLLMSPEEVGEIIVPYEDAATLHEFSTKLGIEPYNGQVKLYNFIDETLTRKCLSVNDEDAFFDFLHSNFYKANLSLATIGPMADLKDATARYVLTIDTETIQEQRQGAWF